MTTIETATDYAAREEYDAGVEAKRLDRENRDEEPVYHCGTCNSLNLAFSFRTWEDFDGEQQEEMYCCHACGANGPASDALMTPREKMARELARVAAVAAREAESALEMLRRAPRQQGELFPHWHPYATARHLKGDLSHGTEA